MKKPNAEVKQILKFKLIEVLKEIYNKDEALSASVSDEKACKYSHGTTFFLGSLFKTFPHNIGYYLNEDRNPLKNIISKTCQNNTNDIVIIDAPSYSCDDCHKISFKDIVTCGKQNGYTLQSIVIGNSIHYVNYSKIKNIWMYYDNQSSYLLERKVNNNVLSFNNNDHALKTGDDITLFFLKTPKDGGRSTKMQRSKKDGKGRRSTDGNVKSKKKSGNRRTKSNGKGKKKRSTRKVNFKNKA